jgi:hypothetical protein
MRPHEAEETFLASEIKGDAVMVAPTVEEEEEEEEEEGGRASAAKRAPEQTEELGKRTRIRG